MKPSLPAARGLLSEQLLARLRTDHGSLPRPDALGARFDPLDDDDLQLALYVCYELHYRSFAEVDELREWDPDVIAFRGALESIFETALLDLASGPPAADVASAIRELGEGGPSRFARFLEKKASLEQFREFLIHRSAYQLKEADPHSWGIPRLEGPAKAALVEIQADEYGGGDPEWMHARLFAQAMEAVGLDAAYGAYLNEVPGTTLATVNLVSMFGLHRRWRGALAGHLACSSSRRRSRMRVTRPRFAGLASARTRRASSMSTSKPIRCTRSSPFTTSPRAWSGKSPNSPRT